MPASIASVKRAGKLANLDKALADEPLPEATTGIGHTRWATHGPPNDRNAHPHLGSRGSPWCTTASSRTSPCSRRAGDAGHDLVSETDTEVAAHLIDVELAAG